MEDALFWFMMGLCGGTFLGVMTQAVSYRHGFHDGALWSHEGESYPSKPGPTWWGWEELRRRLKRPEPKG